ncbi:holin, partial [Serratia marcescens]|nr:holin [Serratia marcescens]
MKMEKLTTGLSYGASGGGAAFWFTRLLDGYSPEQWAAIGVLGGLFFAF